jgi:hypothetical protein
MVSPEVRFLGHTPSIFVPAAGLARYLEVIENDG